MRAHSWSTFSISTGRITRLGRWPWRRWWGLTPYIGNVADVLQARRGTSLTGHELEPSDRVLLAVGALLPLRLSLLEEGPGLLERLIAATGRSAPGSTAVGFIPDSIKDHSGQLVWGQAYHFVEVKARKVLGEGGNLGAMMDYIDRYGGSITLVVRSAKHPDGPTMLTQGLVSMMKQLQAHGRTVTMRTFP